MPRLSRLLALATVTWVIALPAWSGEAEDKQEIEKIVRKSWEMLANRQVGEGLVGPNGVTQAFSSGGLWVTMSQAEMTAFILDSPNTLQLTPNHVTVRFLGANRDVAYVTYYLTGTIVRPDADNIVNYRTRASNVYEKVKGKWVNSGAHYSPLYGGSGLVYD